MCCWILIAFAFAPRVALILMALFNDRISAAFGGVLLPLVGFFLMPWSTLIYTLVSPGGLSLFDTIVLVIAIGADLGIWGGARASVVPPGDRYASLKTRIKPLPFASVYCTLYISNLQQNLWEYSRGTPASRRHLYTRK